MSLAMPSREEMGKLKEKQGQFVKPPAPWAPNVPTSAVIKGAGKIMDDDSYFWVELEMLSGVATGKSYRQDINRTMQDGAVNYSTAELFYAACPEEAEMGIDVWSWQLVGKFIRFTPVPWKSKKTNKTGWNLKNISTAEVPPDIRAKYAQPEGDEIPF